MKITQTMKNSEFARRIKALEKHSHEPFDFTALIERLEAAEATISELQAEHFMTANVSRDGKIVGIDHSTDANWYDVLNAHIVLRDRLNERIREMDKCPFKPK